MSERKYRIIAYQGKDARLRAGFKKPWAVVDRDTSDAAYFITWRQARAAKRKLEAGEYLDAEEYLANEAYLS